MKGHSWTRGRKDDIKKKMRLPLTAYLLSAPTFFMAESADAALYNKTPFPNPVTQNIQSYPTGFDTCVKPLEQCNNGAYAQYPAITQAANGVPPPLHRLKPQWVISKLFHVISFQLFAILQSED